MDKSTLSNYGWIVIAVLVLAVMVALATPFGQFIEAGVKSTAQGLFDVNQSAGAIAGLDIPNQEFEGSNGGGSPAYDHNAPELHPDNGTTPQDGDTYEYGDYKYTYQTSSGGWKVAINTAVTDKNQTTYGAILESINGEPVTDMFETFFECTSLTTAPVIPSSVTNMYCTFQSCSSLTTAPVIPSSVTNMSGTFSNCTALTTAPVIPSSVTSLHQTFYGCTLLKTYAGSTAPDGDFSNYVIPSNVTDMSGTFYKCPSLTTAPVIPSSVTDMTCTFAYCTSLTTAPVIPSSVTNMYATFYNCTSLVTAPDMSNASSVTNMQQTFYNCSSLTTAPNLNNCTQLTNVAGTFWKCTSLKTYIGSTDADGDFSNYVIPSSVTDMRYTFLDCNSITTLPTNYNG